MCCSCWSKEDVTVGLLKQGNNWSKVNQSKCPIKTKEGYLFLNKPVILENPNHCSTRTNIVFQ